MGQHFAIKHPARIEVELVPNFPVSGDDVGLHFYATNGDRVTVVLSIEQANAMVGVGSRDPAKMARDLYVSGRIEIDEFERRLDREVHARGSSVPSTANETYKPFSSFDTRSER